MKRIIPFVKDLKFDTRISEITSIALEHNLQMENNDSVVGNFTISGKYKINDISINEEVFEKVIPFDITLDDKYDMNKVQIDIDDFYYEIINDEYLRVHIDVLADNLVYEQKEIKQPKEEVKSEPSDISELIEDNIFVQNQRAKEEEKVNINTSNIDKKELESNINENEKVVENKEVRNDIVNNLNVDFFSSEEKYMTYKIHIVRETETIEQIKEKYNISQEELEKYNNLDNIVLGTKIIIPVVNE